MEEDRILVEKILKHDRQAFGSLVIKYQRLVYVTCYRLVRSKTDSEDLTQEVFVEVFRSIALIQKDNDLSGWIYKIALNKSLSFLRKHNPVKLTNSVSIETASSSIDRTIRQVDSNTPSQKLEQEESRKIILQAIDRLPENQKKVILLHKFENYSQKEICEQMGISLISVESLIYRAKTNLRKSLLHYFKNQSE